MFGLLNGLVNSLHRWCYLRVALGCLFWEYIVHSLFLIFWCSGLGLGHIPFCIQRELSHLNFCIDCSYINRIDLSMFMVELPMYVIQEEVQVKPQHPLTADALDIEI